MINIINKIQNGEIDLAKVKNNQEKFKSYLGEIKKGKKLKEQKTLCIILICLIEQETKLLHFMMIILWWCLKQKLKQLKEHDLKNTNT